MASGSPITARPSRMLSPGHLAVEVKCRELPQWLQDALSQAQRNALEGNAPLVVLVDSRQGVKAHQCAMMEWHLSNLHGW